jgi:hypothetical protein
MLKRDAARPSAALPDFRRIYPTAGHYQFARK